MRRMLDRAGWIGLIVLGAFMALRLSGCGAEVAPKPAVFSDAITLDAALDQSASTGLPVFVVATADWCGPCQVYKKGALSDEAVASAIRARTIPVYLDVDRYPDAAEALGVTSIPASFLIANDEVVARAVGVQSAEALTDWLERYTKG